MTSRRDLLAGVVAGLLLHGLHARPAHAMGVMRFGVLPVLSPRASLETFQPLLDHLTMALGQRVELLTTPNFHALYQRVREAQFDIALLPPHMSRLAQVDLGWQPMLHCTPAHRSVILALETGGPSRLEELRGGTIAVLDRSALVVLIALEGLRQRGLKEGRDFGLLETRSYESSRLAVTQGRAQALVSRSQGFFKDTQRERLITLLDAGALPGYVFMASSYVNPLTRYRITQDLLDFAKSPAATGMLAKLGYQSMEPVRDEDMRQLDPYLEATRASLNAAP